MIYFNDGTIRELLYASAYDSKEDFESLEESVTTTMGTSVEICCIRKVVSTTRAETIANSRMSLAAGEPY
jgi:hypothetical protein